MHTNGCLTDSFGTEVNQSPNRNEIHVTLVPFSTSISCVHVLMDISGFVEKYW